MSRAAVQASMVEGFVALTINPFRTALATAGVTIGVASVITTLILIDGLERYVRDRATAETDVQSISIAPRTTILRDGFSYPNHGYPIFHQDVAADLTNWLGRSAEVTMTATVTTTVAAANAALHLASATATLANYLSFRRKDVEAGRFFTDGEVSHNAPVVVLSYRLARELSATGDPTSMVGREVRLQGRLVMTIGVMPEYTGETDYHVFIPLRVAGPVHPTLLVRAATLESVPTVVDNVEAWLASRYRAWQARVEITVSAAQLEQIMSALLALKFVMGSLAGVSLIVGAVGIMNVLLASIAERTREIGVRKALGARRRDVLVQFLTEAVAIASVGSGMGTLAGCSLAFVLAIVMRWVLPGVPWQTVITADTLVIGVMSATIMGLASGTLPAVRAARLSPIDAMRRD